MGSLIASEGHDVSPLAIVCFPGQASKLGGHLLNPNRGPSSAESRQSVWWRLQTPESDFPHLVLMSRHDLDLDRDLHRCS